MKVDWVFKDCGYFVKEMGGAAFHEVRILRFADFLLEFLHGEVLGEIDEVVEHFDAKLRDVVDEVGVGAFFLVDHIGEGEDLILAVEDAVLLALKMDGFVLFNIADVEGVERFFHEVGLEPVVTERLEEVDNMLELSGVDDTEPIEVPMDGIADFGDPPVHVLAEAGFAPSKFRR